MVDPVSAIQAPDPDDDLRLAERIAAGDRLAFELLMRRYNRRLFRIARAVLRDDFEAEDALQDAYLAAYRHIGSFRGQARLTTWLSRLVLNECLARLRRQSRRDNVIPIRQPESGPGLDEQPGPEAESPEKAAMRSEMRYILERKLDRLPEPYRLVFVLRCVEDMSVEETARYLDISEMAVRTRLFRARQLLKSALAEDFAGVRQQLYEFGGQRCDRIVERVLTQLDDA